MSTIVHRESSRWRLALILFLASLGMMFVTAAIAFVMVRANPNGKIPPLPVRIPAALWAGTALLAALSLTLYAALVSVRREKQPAMRWWLTATWVLAGLFLVTQSVGLTELLREHNSTFVTVPASSPSGAVGATEQRPDPRSHGLVFALVALHTVHVLGGLPALAVTTVRAVRGRYDHEWHAGLAFCGMYWHFLGAMWLVFLATFVAAG
jgi:cytochrome c oxidase subunit III